jgi:hypothetical protein
MTAIAGSITGILQFIDRSSGTIHRNIGCLIDWIVCNFLIYVAVKTYFLNNR